MSIERIAVIGSGLMGSGIAQVAATSGQQVFLVDVSEEALSRAVKSINWSLGKLAEKGRISESPESVLDRISVSTSLAAAVQKADFVIEAVFEDIELKRAVIKEASSHAREDAILATNTSGLSITVIAGEAVRPERVIGMHWMNPPQLMRLIEVIKGRQTGEETLQATVSLCHRYGKEPVIALRDVWFFLAVRARAGFSIEANLMYARQEADFKELDAVARYRIGLPMGEFELGDFTGRPDIRVRGLRSAEQILEDNPDFEPWPAFLEAYRFLARELWEPMLQKGWTGAKTGRGFYFYPENKFVKPEIPEYLADRVDPLELLAPAINMSAWCVTNGVGTAEDIDKAFELAFNWPRGVFEFLDRYGADRVRDVLKAKERKSPQWLKDFYRADPLLGK